MESLILFSEHSLGSLNYSGHALKTPELPVLSRQRLVSFLETCTAKGRGLSSLTHSRRRALVPKPPADLEPIERVGRFTAKWAGFVITSQLFGIDPTP